MRLADFIESNMKPLLAEWLTFARRVSPAAHRMDVEALLDHAERMLNAVVLDLRTAQTDAEGVAKSYGDGPRPLDPAATASQLHGAGRAFSGFSVSQMVAEYRGLRASVLRQWTAAKGKLAAEDIVDLMRFNEAIDQSVAESVQRYSDDLDHAKEMFLAILAHDLGSPLGAILTASHFMLEEGTLHEPPRTLAANIERSAKRASQMVDALIDFARTRLGPGIPLSVAPVNLATTLHHVVEETKAAYPTRDFQLALEGDLTGEFDESRISQLFGNLFGNAVQHGLSTSPIRITADGRGDEIVIHVRNDGVISAEERVSLFNPFKPSRTGGERRHTSSSLGLGLYIAEQIVTAHRGRIDVASSPDAGTTFSIHLPRSGSRAVTR